MQNRTSSRISPRPTGSTHKRAALSLTPDEATLGGEELKDHITARRQSDLREDFFLEADGHSELGEVLGSDITSTATLEETPHTTRTMSQEPQEEMAGGGTVTRYTTVGAKTRPLRLFSSFEMSPDNGGSNGGPTVNRGAVSSRPRCASDLEAAISKKRRVAAGAAQNGSGNQSFNEVPTISNASTGHPDGQRHQPEHFFSKPTKEFDLDRFTTNALYKVKGQQVRATVDKVPFEYSPEADADRRRSPKEEERDQVYQHRGRSGITSSQSAMDASVLSLIWSLFRIPGLAFNLLRWRVVTIINWMVWILVVLRDHVVRPGGASDVEEQRSVKDQVFLIQGLVADLQVQIETSVGHVENQKSL